jgi:hypothetical protein
MSQRSRCDMTFLFAMKRSLLLVISALALMLGTLSCEQEVSTVNLFVDRADEYTNVSPGQYILFHVKAYSEHSLVHRIECKSFESENGLEKVFDTVVDSRQVEFDYPVLTKTYTTSENMDVKYTFTAYAPDGSTTTFVLHVRVTGNVLLVPYEDLVMYSSCSEKANGLSLKWVTPVIIQSADTASIDVYDYHAPDSDPALLSREWRSMTGLKFIRYNDFNFPAATVKYLQDAYLAGNAYTSVNNLQVGDIILVGRYDEAIGVFLIQQIFDEEGFDNDRYVLSFKKK